MKAIIVSAELSPAGRTTPPVPGQEMPPVTGMIVGATPAGPVALFPFPEKSTSAAGDSVGNIRYSAIKPEVIGTEVTPGKPGTAETEVVLEPPPPLEGPYAPFGTWAHATQPKSVTTIANRYRFISPMLPGTSVRYATPIAAVPCSCETRSMLNTMILLLSLVALAHFTRTWVAAIKGRS